MLSSVLSYQFMVPSSQRSEVVYLQCLGFLAQFFRKLEWPIHTLNACLVRNDTKVSLTCCNTISISCMQVYQNVVTDLNSNCRQQFFCFADFCMFAKLSHYWSAIQCFHNTNKQVRKKTCFITHNKRSK